MRKYIFAKTIIILIVILSVQACSPNADNMVVPEQTEEADITRSDTLYAHAEGKRFAGLLTELSAKVKDVQKEKKEEEERNPFRNVTPDETGKVMIIMFHNFIEEYEDGGNESVTTTLVEFRRLLEQLYNDGYRTAALSDFINGSISVQRGCKPIFFTFDDGRTSQFSLIEDSNGSIIENPNTAVAVMERFYKEYPDFGLNGTFFLNLGYRGTLGTVGTLEQRVEALAEKGFEIENHTYNHANLSKLANAEQIMEEIGKNSKVLSEILPGRIMTIFALPYGNTNKSMEKYLVEGSFEGFPYKNKGIMLVGAEPAAQMYLKGIDTIRIRRILASGITPVDGDFGWWYKLKGKHEFVSDGNPDTISTTADKLELIDVEKVKVLGKEIIVIEEKGEN